MNMLFMLRHAIIIFFDFFFLLNQNIKFLYGTFSTIYYDYNA